VVEASAMLPLAHVVLHVGFCSAIGRVPPGTPLALRVRLTDRIGRPQVERTFRVVRGDDPEAILEFDSAFGSYRLDVAAPKYGCSTTDYLFFIAGHDRSINETLAASPPSPPRPVLLSGTAPQSFLYVQPTFVLFDKSAVDCGKPIPQPLQSDISVENDQDAYYATFTSVSASSAPQLLALRLRTPTHQYHYVRLPIPFPVAWSGWPSAVTLNVTEEMVDGLASEPVATLLCPKMWRTSAG
jgi:hypothetical protein